VRGRKPTPTDIRLARGARTKRRINATEPRHAAIDIGEDAPADLTDDVAIGEWRRVIDTLSRGHITTVDRPTLIAYCRKYAQWRRFEDAAAADPPTIRAPSGYMMPNPLIGMANKALGMMLKAAAELGVTPSSRSRVHAAAYQEPKPGTNVDDFTAWQRKRRKGGV
jgi:P27 family predicted phage terminase small subunit